MAEEQPSGGATPSELPTPAAESVPSPETPVPASAAPDAAAPESAPPEPAAPEPAAPAPASPEPAPSEPILYKPPSEPLTGASLPEAKKDEKKTESKIGYRIPRPSKDGGKNKSASLFMIIKRASMTAIQDRAKIPKYMNSYKLESEKPFNPDRVHKIINQVLLDIIPDTLQYSPDVCSMKAKKASAIIRSRIKEQEYDRYKLICLVTIGEKKSYDIFTGVRFYWDSDRDRFATCKHENMHMFATATVFGLYYE